MQITRQTEYAIKTMLELAALPPDEILSTKTISKRQAIPEDFLKKTIKLLAMGGMVKTYRGSQGGVKLARSPAQITLADIIMAIEGPLAINVCLSPGYHCPQVAYCPVTGILARAQAAMLQELNRETLADLAGGMK